MDPIETCQRGRIDVLIDNPNYAGRVFLEFAGRSFGHVWALNNTLIFKGSYLLLCVFSSLSDTLLDISGKLEGEEYIEEAILGIPNLWSLEELPLLFPYHFQPVPCQVAPSLFTVSAIQITSEEGELIGDWKWPIRRMLQCRIVNIRITDKLPSSFVKQEV
jgi:hypothetical protein